MLRRDKPMKRTMIKRGGPLARGTGGLKRGSRLPPESKKRSEEYDLRATVRDRVFRRDGWRCRAKDLVPSVRCDPGVLDAHEIIPRSAWPGGHLVEDNIVTICRAHHQWVDANPAAAAAVGLHGYSYQRPT